MSPNSLPHLGTFVEAAERESFTAAARALGLSQAAVSQRIQQIEGTLRIALFRREAGRVTLTNAGHRLHGYARRILDLTAEALVGVAGARRETTGELILAASSVPGQHLLPPILSAFRRRHPLVRVSVSVSDTDFVLRQVEQSHAHLGLVGGQGGGTQLEFRRFAGDELVLVVPKGHPWWRRGRATLHELRTQPLILREQGSGSRHCLERSLERRGVTASDLTVALELGNTEAIKEAVFERLGVAVLSRRAVAKELTARSLKPVRVEGLDLDRDMYVVRDRRRILPRAAQLFMDVVGPEPCSAAPTVTAR